MADEEQSGTEEVVGDGAETATADPTAEGAELSAEAKLMAKLEAGVRVNAHDIGPLRKKLDIAVPRDLIDDQMGEQFAELRREAAVPGFRRGRAPLRLVQKRFGQDVGDQLTTQLLTNGYMAAVKKLELKTLGDPLVWADIPEEITDAAGMHKTVVAPKLVAVDQALDHMRMPKEGDFAFSCEVELRPQFELPELDGIAVERAARSVNEEDVNAEVKRLLAFRGKFAPVTEGTILIDDLVVGDIDVVVEGASIKTEANAMLAARDLGYAGLQLKGLGEALVGKTTGDKIELPVTIPDDYDAPDHRGKPATFKLTIQDVKRLQIPELTPELLGELGYKDEAELRELIKGGLDRRVQNSVREAMRTQVTDYLLAHTAFDLPEGLSHRQADAIVGRRMVEMYQAGLPEAEIVKRLDQLRVGAAEKAAVDLKLYFIMDKIAEVREIDVSEDEMNGAIASIASMQNKRFDRIRDELSKNNGMTSLYLRLRDGKILDALLESAKITEK
jgi:trigger factor